MSNTKFTPGPWKDEYVQTSVGGCLKIMPIKACLYADNMYEYAKNDTQWDNVKANAKLMAAAPELLESVKQFVWNWENDIWTDADIEAAKAAIKKATE